MSTGRERLIQACEILNLEYHLNHKVALADGTVFISQFYIPNFSNPHGILVNNFDFMTTFRPYREEVAQMGIGASFWDIDSEERNAFDIADFKEIFCEWGWTGDPAQKPDWITQY